MMSIDVLVAALKQNRLVPFIGSGFSQECGFPDWQHLAVPIAEDLKYPLNDNTDYSILFQYCQDKYKNRNKLNNLLLDTFYSFSDNLENHKLLAELPVSEIWTTNYDKSIEKYFKDIGRKIDVKKSVGDLSIRLSNTDCILYKMHGDLCVPNDCVLTKDDYEKYFHTHEPFVNILKHTLIEKTVLFIGYSLSDPDLQTILSSIRRYYDNNFSTHYWITKKENDCNKRIKQELFKKNLQNYGIETIEIDSYSEITQLFKDLIIGVKRNNVFISGSATEMDADEEKVKNDFIRTLSSELIKSGYTIFNGFGVGVGSSVIEGAYSEIYSNSLFIDSRERIKLYPFYQQNSNTDESKRNKFKTVYRNDMLRQVGVAIFLYGTKRKENSIVDSFGMEEEFDIAKENGIFLIPVCSTGGTSEKLWERINTDLNSYGYGTADLKKLFVKLRDLNPRDNKSSLIETVCNIITSKMKE